MSDVVEKMQRIIASDHCTADQMCGDCPCKETANRIFSEIMSPAIERLRAENEKLREVLAAERERCARVAEQARDDTCDGPVAWSMADCIAAAIRESGDAH